MKTLSATDAAPIPLTIIGGYLGAGKTTLINAVLRQLNQLDRGRVAVLVNDFGALNIDSSLIESDNGATLSLSNGCICCSIRDSLSEALDTVLSIAPKPEQIIVEASGISDPARIAMYGQGWPGIGLDAVIVLVDVTDILKRSADKFVGKTVLRQIRSADLVILNKIDLADVSEIEAVKNWLAQIAPSACVCVSRAADVPLSALLGLMAQPSQSTHSPNEHPIHAEQFRQWSWISETALRRDEFEQQVASWPRSVIRAKGLVCFEDDPHHRYVFQQVGERQDVKVHRQWDSQPLSQLVVLTVGETDLTSARLFRSLETVVG